MPLEIAPWIVPVMLLLGFFRLDRRLRTVRADLLRAREDLRHEVADLRQLLNLRIGELQEQLADREGRPAGLRQTLTGGNAS